MISSMSMSYQSMSQYQSLSCCEGKDDKNNAQEYQAISVTALTIEMNFKSQVNASDNFSMQTALDNLSNSMNEIKDFFDSLVKDGHIDMQKLGYEGKPIDKLSAEDATALIGDGGFFSVENTASRASSFVINFAGDDVSLLKEGRDGIIEGFKEAEKLWGGKLPEIAYKTQELALKQIDEKIHELGANTLDILS